MLTPQIKLKLFPTAIGLLLSSIIWGLILLPKELREFTIHISKHTVCDTITYAVHDTLYQTVEKFVTQYIIPQREGEPILEDFCGQSAVCAYEKNAWGNVIKNPETSNKAQYFILCFNTTSGAGTVELSVSYSTYLTYKDGKVVNCVNGLQATSQ